MTTRNPNFKVTYGAKSSFLAQPVDSATVEMAPVPYYMKLDYGAPPKCKAINRKTKLPCSHYAENTGFCRYHRKLAVAQ